MKTKEPKTESLKAKQVISQLVGNRGSTKDAMLAAGYSEAYAGNPHQFKATKEYQDLIDPIIAKLDKEINAGIKSLPSKRKKAGYGEVGGVLVKLIEKKQLLGGKPTGIVSGLDAVIAALSGKTDGLPKND